MSLKGTPLQDITESALDQLIKSSVQEGRDIEYKRQWQINQDSEKREFLFDVASFANAGGGDLLYGIEEKDGTPTAIIGLAGFIQEQEQLRVEQLLSRGIAPRLIGLSYKFVSLNNGKTVFVIRVPKSWNSPNMVTYNNYNRFYSRHSNGKYQLDVDELRTAFLATNQTSNKIRDFKLERISLIANNQTGFIMPGLSRLILHVIPISHWDGFSYDKIENIRSQHSTDVLVPLGNISSWSPFTNYDGFAVASQGNTPLNSVIQIFRNGAIEGVYCNVRADELKKIDMWLEIYAQKGLARFLKLVHLLDIPYPLMISVALVNIDRFTLDASEYRDHWGIGTPPISRTNLLFPEVLIEDATRSPTDILKPSFDMLLNAFGRQRQ